jgi:hypothetical protein
MQWTVLQEQEMNVRKVSGVALLALGFAVADAGAAAGPAGPSQVGGDDPPVRLLLNVPAHRLYVYEAGQLTRTFRIAVGEVGHETPPGDYRVRDIIWNPWWHPPNSDWARGRQVEPPSAMNPMGRVKMNFSNLLYIHGSPEVGLLGRAASKGCIRMSNEEVMELARLLHGYAHPNLNERVIEDLAANEKATRTYQISGGIPFKVIYQVAEIRDGNLIIYPDIYNKTADFGAQVRAVLSGHGVDPRHVDREYLNRLVDKGRTAIVSAAISELTQGRATVGADEEAAAVR